MSIHRIIAWFPLALFLLLPASFSQAQSVNLFAVMEMNEHLFQSDGEAYLPDGSVVYLIGRPTQGDPLVDGGMTSHGDSLIATSTTGDDVLLAVIRVGEGASPGEGRFQVAVDNAYQLDEINFAYIRFFDSTTHPVSGNQFWGVSDIREIDTFFPGLDQVTFSSGAATNQNHFVVIPEPGTGQLILLFLGLLLGIRMNLRRGRPEAGSVQGPI